MRDLPILQVPGGYNLLHYILQNVDPAMDSIVHDLNLGDVDAGQAAGVNMGHLDEKISCKQILNRRCQEVNIGDPHPVAQSRPYVSVQVNCQGCIPRPNTGNINVLCELYHRRLPGPRRWRDSKQSPCFTPTSANDVREEESGVAGKEY